MSTHSGMIAILIDGDGTVVASAADFGPRDAIYGTDEDGRSVRARQALAENFIRVSFSEDIAYVMEGYDADRLISRLCQHRGYRVRVIAIGEKDQTLTQR